MITVYKKVDKTVDNLLGIEEIKDVNSLDKPILICLSAQDFYDKSVFGTIREGMRGARLLTSNDMAGRYKTNGFPVDFLGLKFKKDEEYSQNYIEIVDKLILPLLFKGSTVDEMVRLARRINFMTYCDGALTYKNIEVYLISKLKEKGLSNEDILRIIQQISLTAIGTMVDTSSLKATSIAFVDVNDDEISSERTEYYKSILNRFHVDSIYNNLRGSNNVIYICNGTGKHSMLEYFKDDTVLKVAVSSVLTMFLESSIVNERGIEASISSESIINRLRKFSDTGKSPQELLSELDDSLAYGSNLRYSDGEAKLKMELNASYKAMQKSNQALENAVRGSKRKDEKINAIIRELRKYSSDVTFYQVLVSSGFYQSPAGVDVFGEASDREIRSRMTDEKSDNKTL